MAEAVLILKNIYSKNRNTFLLLLKILITAGLLAFIIKSVKIRDITSGLIQADTALLLAAFGLSFINIFLQYLKWKLVCSSLLQENNKRKIIDSLFYGFSAGSFTPARIGEYFGRAIPFSDKPLLRTSSAVLIDKLFSMIVVLIFGSVSFILYLNISFGYAIAVILIAAVLIYAGFRMIILARTLPGFKWIQKFNSGLSFIRTLNTGSRLKLAVLSVLFYGCFIIQFALLISAFSHNYNFINYIWAANLVMFAKTIIPPFSPGELGIREGAAVYFLKRLGENAAAGFNASIFLFLINVLLPALIGLIFLLRRK